MAKTAPRHQLDHPLILDYQDKLLQGPDRKLPQNGMQTCPRSAGRRTARAALRVGEAGDATTDGPRLLSDLAGDGGSGRLFTRDMSHCVPG
jgi:hypothetical protein